MEIQTKTPLAIAFGKNIKALGAMLRAKIQKLWRGPGICQINSFFYYYNSKPHQCLAADDYQYNEITSLHIAEVKARTTPKP